MNLISLKTELRQELKLTPQLLQSMEVLQMNSQELLDYLGKISEENPTLELSEASELRSAYAELRQKASWQTGIRKKLIWVPTERIMPIEMVALPFVRIAFLAIR